ncbi:MAG: molybdenum cofactor guanylyltransferase [Candidatus Coatesbacteria bacterium]
MKGRLTGIVLAGGRSRRFGTDKALASWGRGTMIERVLAIQASVFPSIVVVTRHPSRYAFLRAPNVRVVADRFTEQHALGGLLTGLGAIGTPYAFASACDMPFLRPALLGALAARRRGYDAVIPEFGGRLQPLCAVYARRCRGTIRRMIRGGRLRMTGLADEVRTRIVRAGEIRRVDPRGASFTDLDTRAAWARAGGRARA